MTPPSGWRLLAPAFVAAALPIASALVLAQSDYVFVFPTAILRAVAAAAPFVLLAALAANLPRLRPGVGLATGVGLALAVVGWGAGTWDALTDGAPLAAWLGWMASPIVQGAVMLTVLSVRSLFPPGPG